MFYGFMITIVIPTYNERENIGPLIEDLQGEIERMPEKEFTILVVDSNSPDGTGDVVRNKMEKYKNVRLLSGPKGWLGADTIKGIRYALENLEADVVLTMDADFSHDPRDVKRLIARLEGNLRLEEEKSPNSSKPGLNENNPGLSPSGFSDSADPARVDYVIGSRYVKGGSIPETWGVHRKFLSFFGNIVARILGVWRVHDQTPAFRAMRREILKKICFENMPDGYAFQIALVCRASDVGAKFAEVPIHFTDREYGQSKMPLSTILDTMQFLIKYRLRKITNPKSQNTNT
jgi:dolichol-phosphate mannosyltransferase